MNLNISGYGDDLTVNGVKIGDLTPKEQKIMEQWYQSPAYRENIELREKARNILSNMVAFGGKQMSKKSYEKDIWDRYLIHIEAAGFQTQDTEPYNYDFFPFVNHIKSQNK